MKLLGVVFLNVVFLMSSWGKNLGAKSAADWQLVVNQGTESTW